MRGAAMLVRLLCKSVCGPLLAAAALVAVFWAGSYRSISHASLPVAAGSTRCEVWSYRGLISITLIDDFPTSKPASASVRRDDEWTAAAWDERNWSAAIAGFSVEDASIWLTDPQQEHAVVRRWSAMNLPYWLLFSLAALGPLRGVCVALRVYRRTTHGQCGDCGYELGDGQVCQACAARAGLIGASSRVRLVQPVA